MELKMNYLENYRTESIGRVVDTSTPKNIPLLFHYHATTAFYFTYSAIKEFENTSEIINQGTYDRIAVVYWYVVLEDFISTILFLMCEKIKHEDYTNYKKLTLNGKLNKTLELGSYNIPDFKKRTNLLKKIQEFTTVRNELLHRNHLNESIIIDHTLFCDKPFYLNIVDVLQALHITLECTYIFSEIFQGGNIIPKIKYTIGKSFGYTSLLNIYSDFIAPYFKKCLGKNDLQTELDLESPTSFKLDSTTYNIDICINATNRNKPLTTTFTEYDTEIYAGFVRKYCSDIEKSLRGEEFQLPNYS